MGAGTSLDKAQKVVHVHTPHGEKRTVMEGALGPVTTWKGRRYRRVRCGGIHRHHLHRHRFFGYRRRCFGLCLQGVRTKCGSHRELSVSNIGHGFRGSSEDLGGFGPAHGQGEGESYQVFLTICAGEQHS
jgi:hypothetical protein